MSASKSGEKRKLSSNRKVAKKLKVQLDRLELLEETVRLNAIYSDSATQENVQREVIIENADDVPNDEYLSSTDSLGETERLEEVAQDNVSGNYSSSEEDRILACARITSRDDDLIASDNSEEVVTSKENRTQSITKFLIDWKNTFTVVPQAALSSLLVGLQPHFPGLPKDARTLLQTPRTTFVQPMMGGSFIYLGLKNQLQSYLDAISSVDLLELQLDFNIDGLPLYKSSCMQCWPIMGMIFGFPMKKPFIVALYCGTQKPPIKEYLQEFVPELKALMTNGLQHHGKHLKVSVRSFICDAPARSLLKCTAGHTSKEGCEKCCARGEWYGRIVYLEENYELRTNETFRQQVHPLHHKGDSPLLLLDIDLITTFPLDPMHLVYLGVVRRYLSVLKDGTSYCRKSLSTQMLTALNEYMTALNIHWPNDFNRKPRSLGEMDRWKATEFRQFLLYIGVVLLKSTVSDHIYRNFCLLFVAITILTRTDLLPTCINYASELLQMFVSDAAEIFGPEFCVFNIHNLTHLAGDCKLFGVLDRFSAFPFENEMQSIKRGLRKKHQALQQICNRSQEKSVSTLQCNIRDDSTNVIFNSCIGTSNAYKKAILHGQQFSVNQKDNFVLLKNKFVASINKFFIADDSKICIECELFRNPEPLFKYPCSSTNLSIFMFPAVPHTFTKSFPITDIKCKGVLLPHREKKYLVVQFVGPTSKKVPLSLAFRTWLKKRPKSYYIYWPDYVTSDKQLNAMVYQKQDVDKSRCRLYKCDILYQSNAFKHASDRIQSEISGLEKDVSVASTSDEGEESPFEVSVGQTDSDVLPPKRRRKNNTNRDYIYLEGNGSSASPPTSAVGRQTERCAVTRKKTATGRSSAAHSSPIVPEFPEIAAASTSSTTSNIPQRQDISVPSTSSSTSARTLARTNISSPAVPQSTSRDPPRATLASARSSQHASATVTTAHSAASSSSDDSGNEGPVSSRGLLSTMTALAGRLSRLEESIVTRVKSTMSFLPKKPDDLPVKTLEDLHSFEDELFEDEVMARRGAYLTAHAYGENVNTFSRSVCSLLFDHELCKKVNWNGSDRRARLQGKNKLSLKKKFPNVVKLIEVSIATNSSFKATAKKVMHRSVGRWLQGYVDRNGGRLERYKAVLEAQAEGEN